jgi:curved DNA-binding protein CbpA
MSKINHYDVLGVPRDCEQSLIDTVYKSMVKIFHPDVFKGDKAFAQEKLKVVNEAYAVIGNVERRRSYDAELKRSERSGATEEIYEDESSDDQTFDDIYTDDWKVVVGYFPEIDNMYRSLRKINTNLSLTFRIEIVSKKNYRDATQLFNKLKSKFLFEKFGKNPNLHSLVVYAIETGNRNFALELNKDLLILGEDEYAIVLLKLFDKYKNFCTKYYPKCGFDSLVRSSVSFGLQPGRYKTENTGDLKTEGRIFGITANFTAYLEVPSFFGTKSFGYSSIEKLIESGSLSAKDVRTARKIS